MATCSSIGCTKPSTLKCPTCVKLGLPDAFFCSQTCFKESWVVHKLMHQVKPASPSIPEIFAGYKFTGKLRPTRLSARREVPTHIERPDYAEDGQPKAEKLARSSTQIEVRTPDEIEGMRKVCRLAREVLDIAGSMVKPGVTTDEIDRAVHEACIERNSYPSPLNYRGFPKSCCTSINEVICHGIPDMTELKEGDIVNIDITLYHGGFHGDLNETYYVGEVSPQAKKLVEITRECLDKAIALVRPGTLYREVGNVIQKHAQGNGFSVVRSYCGHGIGHLFHTTPSIPHYAKNKAVGVMKPGHIFTIEPMINEGVWKDQTWPDDWTSVTADGKLSAQFEHTLLVTEDGVEVLTKRFE